MASGVVMFSCKLVVIVVTMFAAAHAAHDHHHRGLHRQKKFHVFFHDIANATDFEVVQGLVAPGAQAIAKTAPFGSIFVANDPVTAGPTLRSPLLGALAGTSVSTSSEVFAFFGSFTLTLNMSSTTGRRLEGSLAFMGVYKFGVQPTPLAIVGGTGSFLFAQGSVTFAPVDISTFNQTLRLDADVFWPPSYYP